jgi:catechol 2,3-dioxygenase
LTTEEKANEATDAIEVPSEAMQPDHVNHLVLNCTDLDRTHKFWTEIVGFRQVAQIPPDSDKPRARFYVGRAGTGHHDIAFFQIEGAEPGPDGRQEWSMRGKTVGVNHVAIRYQDREAWLKQLAFIKSKHVKFHVRTEHGMTHSAYISDPDGYGIEVLYEVPREAWIGDPGAAVIWAKPPPGELEDDTNYKVFGKDEEKSADSQAKKTG